MFYVDKRGSNHISTSLGRTGKVPALSDLKANVQLANGLNTSFATTIRSFCAIFDLVVKNTYLQEPSIHEITKCLDSFAGKE